MRVSDAFPSNYLKASDLQGRAIIVAIDRCEIEAIGDERKPILYFQGKQKGMVLNKTNANNVAVLYGDDTDDWGGQPVELFEAMVDFQGKTAFHWGHPPSPRADPNQRDTKGRTPLHWAALVRNFWKSS